MCCACRITLRLWRRSQRLQPPHRQAPPCGWAPHVLKAGFYKPARTRGRPGQRDQRRPAGTGLGAGYAREDFEVAELAFPNARSRVDHLEHVITYIWDRVPTLAAREANIVGLTSGAGRKGESDLPEADVLALPGVMTGTPRDIADTLRDYRDSRHDRPTVHRTAPLPREGNTCKT
jgi:hypothetical protein